MCRNSLRCAFQDGASNHWPLHSRAPKNAEQHTRGPAVVLFPLDVALVDMTGSFVTVVFVHEIEPMISIPRIASTENMYPSSQVNISDLLHSLCCARYVV